MAFEAGPETLSRTNLGELAAGSLVNLERSLRAGQIDWVGILSPATSMRRARCSAFGRRRLVDVLVRVSRRTAAANGLQRFDRGGRSEPDPGRCRTGAVQRGTDSAHTWPTPRSAALAMGGRVNLETDLLAKYVQQQLERRT